MNKGRFEQRTRWTLDITDDLKKFIRRHFVVGGNQLCELQDIEEACDDYMHSFVTDPFYPKVLDEIVAIRKRRGNLIVLRSDYVRG